MPLQIGERQVGDVTVLDLWGQIMIGDTSETLRSTIKQLTEAGHTKVLLHLGVSIKSIRAGWEAWSRCT
jgi:hypothetical protein